MRKFVQSWLINTLAVLLAVYLMHGKIHYEKPLDLVVASLLLGILNAFLRPILMFLALPLLLFTLGLFTLVINAALLYLVSALLGQQHFYVDSFSTAFWGALIISVASFIINVLTGASKAHVHIHHRPRPKDTGPGGNGPVIDI